ncbi:hypothetical protein [Streptomyces natalensis]|uniref:Uncharacterized protein n=1 Tax=Streptomyces natalensis ATCC 27448 TaxID=1240678 RepID=A0A0D7CHS8_9ACTN|nr:hypothetical protein [Streptomyces natalensis]KIZ14977.1 hypothetical protein SNA_29825 [Streptomyces natalensis ATCC 27448]
MSGGPVNPAEVPVYTGNLHVLEAKTKALSRGGSKVQTAGSDVHKSFGGLAAFYKAPEAEQLFGVTKPVADTAQDLSDDMHVIAKALGTYAHEIRPLIQRLKQLKKEAADFRDNEAAEDDWSEDGDLVEENLNRRNKIAEVWAAFQKAERDCHAKIVHLVGGKALHAIDASHKDGYGYDAEALKASKTLPWGEAVEESVPAWQVWEHAYDFAKGFIVDGVGGTIDGLYTLFGGHGGDAAGAAWTGLAKLSTAFTITMLPIVGPAYLAAPGDILPSWLRDSRTAVLDTGKAMVAWDQWKTNGSRAAGAVTFNIVTAVFTRGGGAAVEGAGKAGMVAKSLSVVSKVGHYVDPMTYVFKGAGAGLSKVGDVMARLKGVGRVEVPKISEGAFSLPEGAVKLADGTVQLPEGAAIPEGATKLSDGTIKLPKDTVTFPPDTVKDPVSGKYMSGRGDLYNEDGSLFQRAEDAPKDNPAPPAAGADNPRIETPVHQEQRVPASVGGRGEDTIRVGSDISDPGRVGENAGHRDVGSGDNTPRSRAGDHSTPGNHTPSNSLDNNPTVGRSGDNTPTTGGGRDLPGSSATDHGVRDGSMADTHLSGGSGHPEPRGDAVGDVPTSAGDGTGAPQHNSAPRPSFMHEGDNPYGPRGSLTHEQIQEIQVYRANHEPGYREHYYRKDGTRKDLDLYDESGQTPPQLTRLSENAPWIRAKDAPEPPKPHFLDRDYISVGADTVTSPARREILEEAARERHFAVKWDNIVSDWKAETGKAHQIHDTPETAAHWGEARGTYKESHTAMGDATEAFGEKAAEYHYVAENYPDFDKQTLLGPKNGNDQFDQVWKHDDGRIVVVEAKSSADTELGGRTLPNGRKVSQGSREYFFDILKAMEKRGEDDLVDALEKALDEGKLDYVVVKGEKNTGKYTGYQYRRFDISKGTLP